MNLAMKGAWNATPPERRRTKAVVDLCKGLGKRLEVGGKIQKKKKLEMENPLCGKTTSQNSGFSKCQYKLLKLGQDHWICLYADQVTSKSRND